MGNQCCRLESEEDKVQADLTPNKKMADVSVASPAVEKKKKSSKKKKSKASKLSNSQAPFEPSFSQGQPLLQRSDRQEESMESDEDDEEEEVEEDALSGVVNSNRLNGRELNSNPELKELKSKGDFISEKVIGTNDPHQKGIYSSAGKTDNLELKPKIPSNFSQYEGQTPSAHKNNYIVVVEPDQNRKSSDDFSKSRSFCKSIEKSIEEKLNNRDHLDFKDPESYIVSNLDSDVHTRIRNEHLFSGGNTIAQKNEHSILKTKLNIEDYPSVGTLENTSSGKVKDTLKVTKLSDLVNPDLFSDTKYLKTMIQLKGFDNSMTTKFINFTSFVISDFVEVNIHL